ncbi:MAG TPA: tetratricopeptide repeat protein, partial [Methylomirabilota bacterium]|nr:tetratricopeptide repeat protein [Methylomirabilota bacterium]
ADEYRYWLGEAYAQTGNYRVAAETLASVAREFTNSARLLEASYGEALARFRLKDWKRVAALIEDPAGTFQRAAAARASDELVVRGRLLLGEALFEAGEFARAREALHTISEAELIPEYKWRRQYLLCRVHLAEGRLEETLTGTTNLVVLAAATGQRNLEAESISMQGEVLRRLGRLEEAARAYERNLSDTTPPDRQRRALLHLIQLALAEDRIEEAEQRLTAFLARRPEDAATDIILLTLGEVNLRRHLRGVTNTLASPAGAPANGVTNHLQAALAQFDTLLRTQTNSPLRGRAQAGRGWCHWIEGRLAESQAAFKAAAELLPPSDEQAVARFKLADTLFLQNDHTNAVQHYRALLVDFAGVPQVREVLFDRAWYQVLRASLALNDTAGAQEAMRRLLREHPESFFADRSMVLLGHKLMELGEPAEARTVLEDFVRRYPQSELRAEVELSIARSAARQSDWRTAIQRYDGWLERFATNVLRPRAEFDRAWAYAQSGQATQALALFTNFVTRFPTHELAPLAQSWIGYHYFEARDFINAQRHFQTIVENTNWPVTRLTFQARMMAGHAAFARQGWKDAAGVNGHYTLLVSTCPYDDLVAEALFALGDTYTQDPDPANPLKKFDDARVAFQKITTLYPTNPLVSRAWGRMGDCYLQLAANDPKLYANALESYQRAMLPPADVETRSLAQFALGQALERQAPLVADGTNLLRQAFEHYYAIVTGKNLLDNEQPVAHVVKQAGLAAARLKESRGEWEIAARIYQRLGDLLPSQRAMLERRRQRAIEQRSSVEDP